MTTPSNTQEGPAVEVTRRDLLIGAGAVAATSIGATASQAQEATFTPNKLTFAQGIDRIKKALETVGGSTPGKIVTSRDANADKLLDALMVSNIPSGFTKYQLPVYFTGGPGSQFFISIGAPNTEVPRHSHDEGDGIRFIMSGSIIFDGRELSAGDWMFIPKGQPYSFKVGKTGVGMCYCYQCCCA